METLDIEIDGKKSKENLMEILSAWCLKPEPRKLRQKKSEKTTDKTEKRFFYILLKFYTCILIDRFAQSRMKLSF